MISEDDKSKLDRIDYLKMKVDFEYVWLPLMIFISVFIVSVYWVLTGQEWKLEYLVILAFGLISLLSFIFRLKERREAKKETKQLKGELGI
jgi:membrane protein implicated in regulation of membrane protease activity